MMNNAWKEFLAEDEAMLTETGVGNIDDRPEISTSNWLAPLVSRAVIKISGEDALEFLHGQFSNDLKSLESGHWQLSSYSTPKGRLLAVFRITKLDDHFYIEVSADVVESFQKRLTMFVMRSKVTLENVSAEMLVCGLVGAGSAAVLEGVGITVPAEGHGLSASQANDVLVMRELGSLQRFVILASPAKMNELWQAADTSVLRTIENTWVLSQVENGQPDVFEASREQFVAQMMNLHVLEAVNFKKGCYPGQEVVARLQYLGKLKRRMYRFAADCETLPTPGSEVFVEGEEGAAGKVAIAAFSSSKSIELLAVMKVASVESEADLSLASGETLRLLELPYAFAEESE